MLKGDLIAAKADAINVMETDAFTYINRAYGTSFKKGDRVEYTGSGKAQLGTVTSADGGKLRIRIDGYRHSLSYHPTWSLRSIQSSKTGGAV
jgi:hypothetical protein